MADVRGSEAPRSPNTDRFLRFRHPKLQSSYLSWLGTSCSNSDVWSISLYALLCVALTNSMVKRVGEIGVPSIPWLLFGLLSRLLVCSTVLFLRLRHTDFYLRHRTLLLNGVVLLCHCNGLVLEAPLAYYLASSAGSSRYAVPLVGQVFELLGFRVSLRDHIYRGLLDTLVSGLALSINYSCGWVSSVPTKPGVMNLVTLFVNEFVLCNLVIMTAVLYVVERRSQAKFASSAAVSKLLGTDSQTDVVEEEEEEEEETAPPVHVHLSGPLEAWAEMHKKWVPRCPARVLSVKFEGPDFESLNDLQAEDIRTKFAEQLCNPDFYFEAAFIEGCIQVIATNYQSIHYTSSSGDDSGGGSWYSPHDVPSDDDESMELEDMAVPTTSEVSGCGPRRTSGLSSSNTKDIDRQYVRHMLDSVPQDWLLSGRVSGFTQSLGRFEYSAETNDIVITDVEVKGAPSILGALPACASMSHGSPVRFDLICSMRAGDPIICLQEGRRVPLSLTGSTQLDSADHKVTYQVTVEVMPSSTGYLEFYILSKAHLLPYNDAMRTVDSNRCADEAFRMFGAAGLTDNQAGEVVSQPAPVLVLNHAQACWDLATLVQPLAAYEQLPVRNSTEIEASSLRSDDSDSDSEAHSSCVSSFTRVHVQNFQHFPESGHVRDLSSIWESARRYEEVKPTLTLCGVVLTFFRLTEENTQESHSRRRDLLIGRDITSMEEWRHLVESCVLFMARNGLPHATMLFLRQALQLGLCRNVKNLMHYAVASGSADLVRALTHECGAALSQPSDHGTTPLHLAAVLDSPDVLAALLENSSHCIMAMECADASGKTPMSYAMETGLVPNCDLIKSRYAVARFQGQPGTAPAPGFHGHN